MKIFCRIICVVMSIIALLSVYLIAETFFKNISGGFLDLTNIARFIYAVFLVVSASVAALTGYFGWRKKNG